MQYNLDYLNSLIENKVEENLNLEYKAAKGLGKQNNKTTEISKDVSAMANSDGGILIYGLSEIDHLPQKIDPINRTEFSKEWLEHIIHDKIRPRINNVKIFPIEIEANQVVYVVEVPKSNTAHQAFDKKYYKRFNFRSTAMHDYEIRDILNRSKHPSIELEFELKNSHSTLVLWATNHGSILAKYLNVHFRIPKKIVEGNEHSRFKEQENENFSYDNTVRDVVDVEIVLNDVIKKYGPSRYDPILPSQRFLLAEIKLTNYPFDFENIIEWDIFCDNASPKSGSIRLRELLNK